MKSKLLAILLCLCLCIPTLVSCGEENREYVESEVVAATKELIQKSLILNEIYWGDGIRYEIPEGENVEIKGYLPARQEHLDELSEVYGIRDLATLKEKTREVFSETGYNWVVSSCLTNVTGETGIIKYARYYQSTKNSETGAIDALMVYTEVQSIYENTQSVEYIYDDMHVTGVDGEVITVSLKVKTVGKNGESNTRPFTVQVIEEASGWRLHGASYATHPISAS